MSREEQIKAGRRRRQTGRLNGTELRLWVDEGALDKENYHYRFATNDPERIRRLTQFDDYEIVTDRDGEVRDSDGLGSAVEVDAGSDGKGNPQRLVLLRKPLKYYNDDQREAQKRVDYTETMIREGNLSDGEKHAHSYRPEGAGVRIGRQE